MANNNFNGNPSNFFGQPPMQQMQGGIPVQTVMPMQGGMQSMPGYGYPLSQPQYNPQNPYVVQPQAPVGGYRQPANGMMGNQPSVQPQRFNSGADAWNSYSGSIDAEEKLEEMEKVIDAINNNIDMSGEGLKDSDLAETLANREFDAVLLQMEHLSSIVATPEKWFPKGKENMIEKFKPNLLKLSSGLKTYIDKLKMI